MCSGRKCIRIVCITPMRFSSTKYLSLHLTLGTFWATRRTDPWRAPPIVVATHRRRHPPSSPRTVVATHRRRHPPHRRHPPPHRHRHPQSSPPTVVATHHRRHPPSSLPTVVAPRPILAPPTSFPAVSRPPPSPPRAPDPMTCLLARCGSSHVHRRITPQCCKTPLTIFSAEPYCNHFGRIHCPLCRLLTVSRAPRWRHQTHGRQSHRWPRRHQRHWC